jgi:hypothetical protein
MNIFLHCVLLGVVLGPIFLSVNQLEGQGGRLPKHPAEEPIRLLNERNYSPLGAWSGPTVVF